MALVFAVFLIAMLAVFLRPEGRAARMERLSARAARIARASRTVLARGTAITERIAAGLAEDHRHRTSLDRLLTDRARVADAGASSADGLDASAGQ
jgi:hypothetical protein